MLNGRLPCEGLASIHLLFSNVVFRNKRAGLNLIPLTTLFFSFQNSLTGSRTQLRNNLTETDKSVHVVLTLREDGGRKLSFLLCAVLRGQSQMCKQMRKRNKGDSQIAHYFTPGACGYYRTGANAKSTEFKGRLPEVSHLLRRHQMNSGSDPTG